MDAFFRLAELRGDADDGEGVGAPAAPELLLLPIG